MQLAAGSNGTFWSGVRNHLAKQNLMAMKRGDRGFFYHSNEGKEIVGIVEIVRGHYPDPTAKAGEPWVAVDIKAIKSLAKPVTLAHVKAELSLAKMALITSARLSVQPVTQAQWQFICAMGGIK